MPSAEAAVTAPRFSVIIPTFQRRELVVATLDSLLLQRDAGAFEVIVVVDGSTDGTPERLRALRDLPFPLIVLEQPRNLGQARARNRGSAAARGALLLFLDDDMEADAHLLAEHERSHRDGAQVVLGAIPMHDDSIAGPFTDFARGWFEAHAQRLASANEAPTFNDFCSGQLSVRREIFLELGGFDERFTRGEAAYGNEDAEFGYRVQIHGFRVAFNANAVSRQRYIIDATTQLRRERQQGRADVVLVRKHPELAGELLTGKLVSWRSHRVAHRLTTAAPRLVALLAAPARRLFIYRVAQNRPGALSGKLSAGVTALEYWGGVQEAGGIPRPQPIRVLAYHAVADLAGDPVLEPYGVAPQAFLTHLNMLMGAGYHFLDTNEFLRALTGRAGVPERAILLTFDDCYEDLARVAVPALAERGIPALAFAVSGLVGGTNDWDRAKGARSLPLLGRDALMRLSQEGVEIGTHSRTHAEMVGASPDILSTEVSGSVAEFESLGLPRPRCFAYPFGEHDAALRHAAHAAGLQAAFTSDAGMVETGCDPFRIPRLVIMRRDVGWKFRLKVALADPEPNLRTVLQHAAARARASIRRWAPRKAACASPAAGITSVRFRDE